MRGPAPQYQPKFSRNEIKQVRAAVRKRTAPHAHVQRAQLALLLVEDPAMRNTTAAQRVGLTARCVHKWRKRWALDGFSLEDRPRSGRPRKFSPSDSCASQSRRVRDAQPRQPAA